MLYAREFLAAARRRLSPGGVYAQWFHTYAMDASTLALVLNTYRQVFPRASVWFTAKNDVILVGFADDDERGGDLARVAARWSQERFRSRFGRIGVTGVAGLLAHELWPSGVLAAARLPDAVHTLSHPILSDHAARAFFSNETAPFPATHAGEAARIGASNSLLNRWRVSAPAAERAAQRASMATQACFRNADTCTTFLALWYREDPTAPALTRLLGQARSFWGSAVDETVLPWVASLFGGDAGDGPLDYADAARLAALYEKHYSHGAPFEPRALHDAWRRCAATGDERCREGLHAVASLDVPPPPQGHR
jgi:hypothetical protein